jgi:K+ transporter
MKKLEKQQLDLRFLQANMRTPTLQSGWLPLLFATFLFYYLIMKKRKSSIKKLKRKKKRRSSAELHKVLPTLKLVEDKKPEKKEIKTISEQSQDELEPIISTPITSPMSDE